MMRMKKKRWVTYTISLMIFYCLLYGNQKQEKLPPPDKHEVSVRLILVDAIATDRKGNFVTDLKKEDFELYEDGVKVPINSLELISFVERKMVTVKDKSSEEIPQSSPEKKLIVIFDGVNSWSKPLKRDSNKIMSELISLVEEGNEVMIMYLDEKKGIEILQSFTSSEELIHQAVKKAVGSIWIDKSLESLPMAQVVGTGGSGDQAQGQRFIGKRDLFENLWDEYSLSETRKFEITIGGLLAVFNRMKDMSGRKSILLISDGIPNIVPERSSVEIDGGKIILENPRIFDPLNILNNEKYEDGEEVIQKLIQYANTQNISIYTLDLGSFSEYFFTATAESSDDEVVRRKKRQEKMKKIQNLRWISEDTGAVSLRGAKKLDNFRKVMQTDLNHYYELSYYPPRNVADSKYHNIRVKVKRSGVKIRFRRGYTDYSDEEKMNMLLLSAFYNPNLYQELPLKAEFIPFHKESDTYVPWINIALPVKEIFLDSGLTYGPKEFSLHIWIKDNKRAEMAFKGKIIIPFNIDSQFMEAIRTTEYICCHFKGSEIPLSQNEYETIFALYDDQTKEIGAWESSLLLPNFKENKLGAIINCVLGSLTLNPDGEAKPFSLSKRGGYLEYGEMKFYPSVTRQFQRMEDSSIFIQAFYPHGKPESRPVFSVFGESRIPQNIKGELVGEDWNEKSRVWSGIFFLDLRSVPPGDYKLKIDLSSSKEGIDLSQEVNLTKLNY
jgi:VWFA-related protein